MKSFLLNALMTIALLTGFSSHAQVTRQTVDQNSAMKEFVMACTYGVLTGTLVGAATLAFTEEPGDNLNKVARGASIGLYAGILLGLYVVYVVPEEPEIDQPLGLPPVEGASRFQIFPLITEKGVEGVASTWRVMSF